MAAANSNELTKRIIPCLDVTDGKVVKGVRFEDLKDAGDPVALGKKYSEEGADELVFLDITASKDNRQTLFNVVKDVAKNIFIPFTVGGGLQNIDDIRTALLLGADKVSLNTSAIKNPDLISEAAAAFGEQCVVVAMDVKKIGDKYKVFKKGGSVETELEAIAWAKEAVRRGAGEILLTSMDRDGTKLGYDLDITRAISEAVSVPVIASGGAGSLEDFKTVLTTGKADAALAASLFHYEESSVGKVKKYLSANNVPVRL
ncbi:MAG TPA: imidazole glycerol phosphate synthase subunit HisF [Candidatus Paceibacterota bacterium]